MQDQDMNGGVLYLRGDALPEDVWSKAGVSQFPEGRLFSLAGRISVITQVLWLI